VGHFVGIINNLQNCVLKPITNVQQKLRKIAFIKEALNNLSYLTATTGTNITRYHIAASKY